MGTEKYVDITLNKSMDNMYIYIYNIYIICLYTGEKKHNKIVSMVTPCYVTMGNMGH
jgi:hypothetical protein